jgi:prophage DNA circulation protein
MDQATFQVIVALHAALNGFLTSTARPLPMMLKFIFAKSMASIVMAHRLYADASRADELRVENKTVHPAFMRMTGRALSG